MEEPSFFDRIPDRILLEIFKLLDLKSLAKARCVSRRFYDVITTNHKYLPKPTQSFQILATKDDHDNPTVEFLCDDQGVYIVCCSSTEIAAKPPFYIDYGVDLEKNKYYSKCWKKEQAFRYTFSRTIADGREFDESHPLPSTSIASSFEEALNFYLSHFDLCGLGLSEDERSFTPDEMSIIWRSIRVNRTRISSISMSAERIDDAVIDIVRRTNCSSFSFHSCFEGPRRELSPDDENNGEKRITELPCETFYGFISVEKILELLQQWANRDRSIHRYNLHHNETGLDWFPPVLDLQNIEVISEPEDIMWTMNADVWLKTFQISRKIDGKRLDFHYWNDYIEISHYEPPKPYVAPSRNNDDEEDDDEDYGFGLFDL